MTKFRFKDFSDAAPKETVDNLIAEFMQLASYKKQQSFEKLSFDSKEKTEIPPEITKEEIALKNEFLRGYESGKSETTNELVQKHRLEIEKIKVEAETNLAALVKKISEEVDLLNKNTTQIANETTEGFGKLVISATKTIVRSLPDTVLCQGIIDFLKESVVNTKNVFEIKVHSSITEMLSELLAVNPNIRVVESSEILEKSDCIVQWDHTTIEKIAGKNLDKIEEITKKSLASQVTK